MLQRRDPDSDDTPVNLVSLYDAMRFVNWLENGQPDGPQDATTTEDGAYTITPAGIAANSIVRNPGALYCAAERGRVVQGGSLRRREL